MNYEIIFWGSAALLFYTYIGYPLLLVVFSLFTVSSERKEGIEPSVSVVIATYNEGSFIGKRIRNILEQEYPANKLEVIVVSDGSTDNTKGVLESISEKRLTNIHYAQNRGKADALNLGVKAATGEIVVFADSRQLFLPNVVRQLVQSFADSKIGAVTGELILTLDDQSEAESIGLYWRYEKAIRELESKIDSTVGVTGAIYAIRRELYSPLPPRTILDDVIVPMRIVKQGYRTIMEREAIAYEPVSATMGQEFRRKVRTLAGNFEVMAIEPWITVPWRNRLFLQWFSHKFLRLVAPYALILLFATSFLAQGLVFDVMALIQSACYMGALCGWLMVRSGRDNGLLNIFTTFVTLNIAAMAGLLMFIQGDKKKIWSKN